MGYLTTHFHVLLVCCQGNFTKFEFRTFWKLE